MSKMRGKMSPADRAKQFMPFAALKGYEEAIHKKERIIVPKMELSEDYREELDRKLASIHKNDMVTAIYFHNDEYLKVTGVLTRIDETARVLKIVNTKIHFRDLYDISLSV